MYILQKGHTSHDICETTLYLVKNHQF